MSFALGAYRAAWTHQAPSMQKEDDHRKDEGNKDSKEERSQDAVEETVRKRVRTNTPSPHRGNTPQGETLWGHGEVTHAGFSVCNPIFLFVCLFYPIYFDTLFLIPLHFFLQSCFSK